MQLQAFPSVLFVKEVVIVGTREGAVVIVDGEKVSIASSGHNDKVCSIALSGKSLFTGAYSEIAKFGLEG